MQFDMSAPKIFPTCVHRDAKRKHKSLRNWIIGSTDAGTAPHSCIFPVAKGWDRGAAAQPSAVPGWWELPCSATALPGTTIHTETGRAGTPQGKLSCNSRKQFLHFPFQTKGTCQVSQGQKQNKCSPVHWNQTATLRAPSCHRSDQGQLAEQYHNSCGTQLGAFWGVLQMNLLEHTHHKGTLCLSLLFTPRNRNWYWNTTASKELWASSYHSWLTDDCYCYHTNQADKA